LASLIKDSIKQTGIFIKVTAYSCLTSFNKF